MLPEDHVVFHVHNVHYVIWVILLQEVQYFEFYASLVLVFLLVLHNFDCHFLLSLVIQALQCLYLMLLI